MFREYYQLTSLLNTDFRITEKIPLQKIEDDLLQEKEISLYVLRLDLTHPQISGNKWFKLKYNLQEAKRQGKTTLLTFGGAYSNHIVATAAAGKEFGFNTIGIIRGEELEAAPPAPLHRRGEQSAKNQVLQFAEKCGMELRFVSREQYREMRSNPYPFISLYPYSYFLPEGGTNVLAVKGCAEITSLIDIPFNYIACAVGTGGTIAGIISSLKENQKAIGFPVLKGGDFLKDEIEKLVTSSQVLSLRAKSRSEKKQFELKTEYHFGGYAKKNNELLNFIADFNSNHNIPLDFVYTGKMMFGVFDLVKKDFFEKGKTVVAVHTGGIPALTPD